MVEKGKDLGGDSIGEGEDPPEETPPRIYNFKANAGGPTIEEACAKAHARVLAQFASLPVVQITEGTPAVTSSAKDNGVRVDITYSVQVADEPLLIEVDRSTGQIVKFQTGYLDFETTVDKSTQWTDLTQPIRATARQLDRVKADPPLYGAPPEMAEQLEALANLEPVQSKEEPA